jgi:hypothetical protein
MRALVCHSDRDIIELFTDWYDALEEQFPWSQELSVGFQFGYEDNILAILQRISSE